jgi:stage III sporulation protein AE
MGGLMKDLVFPLILFAGILGMVNFLVEGFQVNKLANFLKSAALGMMGLAMAIFIGIITIRGFAGSIADTTALRTAKYVSNAFLPVVGGALSDTMEMAVGCSTVLKGGLGIFGLGLIVLIIAFPLIKILAVAVIYQLSSAVIQPLGNNRLADALSVVGGTFLNLFAAVAVVGLMFFIALAILVGIAGMRIS